MTLPEVSNYGTEIEQFQTIVTKTRPCIILQFFTVVKKDNFQMKKCDIFLIFTLKHRLWVHVRTDSFRRF